SCQVVKDGDRLEAADSPHDNSPAFAADGKQRYAHGKRSGRIDTRKWMPQSIRLSLIEVAERLEQRKRVLGIFLNADLQSHFDSFRSIASASFLRTEKGRDKV